MLILALGHKARNGKDTVAQAIKEAYAHHDIRLVSFADPLRAEVREAAKEAYAINFPGEEFNSQLALRMLCGLHGVQFEENAIADADYPWGKQRQLHQYWGTEYRRAQDDMYWVKKGMDMIVEAQGTGADAVIFRDLRFPNEYDMIGALGGYRVKVSRLGYDSGVPQHISETALDNNPFDFSIGVCDGHLSALQRLGVALYQITYHLRGPRGGLPLL